MSAAAEKARARRYRKRGRRPAVGDLAQRVKIAEEVELLACVKGKPNAFRIVGARHRISKTTAGRIYYRHRALLLPPEFVRVMDRIRSDVQLVIEHVPEAYSQDDDVLELIDAGGLTVAWAKRLRDCAPSELAHVVALIRSDIAGIVLLLKK